jgi:hypothetical protein
MSDAAVAEPVTAPKRGRKPKAAASADDGAPDASLLDSLEQQPEAAAAEKKPDENTPAEPTPPDINAVDWTPYVLSKLQPDEIWDGCPTYEGLRRLTHELLGVIVEYRPRVVQAPNSQNFNHSCVEYTFVIEHFDNAPWLGDLMGRSVSYGGVADVFDGNGDALYSWRFSSATCETRAKSRALRDAFRLRHVRVREEVSELKEEESGLDGTMNTVQTNALKLICGRIDVNVWKYLNAGEKKYPSVKAVPYAVAQKALAHVQGWQQDRNKIKPELRGYDPNWAD